MAAVPATRAAPSAAVLAVAVVSALLLADATLAQTFSYSRGWKSGKRSSAGAAVMAGGPGAGPAVGGRTTEDILAEDLPLYRYFLEGRTEHRVPFDPWRLVDAEPVLHLSRRPALAALPVARAVAGEQGGDHEDR
ncbi:hypothetical protein ONE63_010042 [Megalurothrips usitatus]|uniref:Pro-corazonin n=1 Tax=Megalurothrips usitatus TaxID=439358 RepID=A0AAV7XKC1_9NEOP|nr:hypothetical protein ONE63_010042 [Megalurothrips usitatus]